MVVSSYMYRYSYVYRTSRGGFPILAARCEHQAPELRCAALALLALALALALAWRAK